MSPERSLKVMTRERTFSVVPLYLWNDFPSEVLLAPSPTYFQCQAETDIFLPGLRWAELVLFYCYCAAQVSYLSGNAHSLTCTNEWNSIGVCWRNPSYLCLTEVLHYIAVIPRMGISRRQSYLSGYSCISSIGSSQWTLQPKENITNLQEGETQHFPANPLRQWTTNYQ